LARQTLMENIYQMGGVLLASMRRKTPDIADEAEFI
jgi:hypothetical protein